MRRKLPSSPGHFTPTTKDQVTIIVRSMYDERCDIAPGLPIPTPRSVGCSMVTRTAVWMTGLAFCLGLVLGLLCHLPGVSSPLDGGRHPRAAGGRFLFTVDTAEQQTQPANDWEHGNKLPIERANADEYHTSVVVSTRKAPKHIHDISDTMNTMQTARNDIPWVDLSVTKGPHPAVTANLANMSPVKGMPQRPDQGRRGGGVASEGQPSKNAPLIGSNIAGTVSTNMHHNVSGHNHNTNSLVEGIYWSGDLDLFTPRAFTQESRAGWRKTVENAKIIGLSEGCGRMQNRQLLFDDGEKACGRYRINQDQIQGEVYSFYLSRLLGMDSVPPPVLLLPQSRENRWSQVSRGLVNAQWHPQRPVIVTPWMDHLVPAYIPPSLRPDNRTLHPTDIRIPPGRLTDPDTMRTLTDLVQWSDLIVFDYLTANLDRVVNNMFNKQWNPDMMNNPTHNLEQDSQTQALVFLDNESGLFHSYRLLDKYGVYHDTLLKSLCIFRRGTADKIQTLHQQGSVGHDLDQLIQKEEPLSSYVAKISERNIRTLKLRIANVVAQIEQCQHKYGNRS